ncbi:MAG: hypothetical protein V4649_10220 [Bacteroidota bacterium]
MIKLPAIVLLALGSLTATAQVSHSSAAISRAVSEQADRMGKLMLAKDFVGFVKYMNADVLKMIGGKEKVITTMRSGTTDMKKKGFSFNSVTFGKPSAIIDTAGTLQCILPEQLRIHSPQGDMINHTSLFALSKDNGKTWTFTEVNPELQSQLRQIVPVMSSKLKVPPGRKEQVK